MIKLLVKLAVAALVANALFRIGSEYLTFFRFRDSVRDAAIYRAKTDAELRGRIVALAADYDIPLDGEGVAIVRQNRLVTVSAAYAKPIEVFPNYSMQWPFDMSLEVQMSVAPPLAGAPPPP